VTKSCTNPESGAIVSAESGRAVPISSVEKTSKRSVKCARYSFGEVRKSAVDRTAIESFEKMWLFDAIEKTSVAELDSGERS
jgi:hypothetical protein